MTELHQRLQVEYQTIPFILARLQQTRCDQSHIPKSAPNTKPKRVISIFSLKTHTNYVECYADYLGYSPYINEYQQDTTESTTNEEVTISSITTYSLTFQCL